MQEMATFLQFITQPINELLIQNFQFYLPKIYQNVLREICANEHNNEFAILLTYTAKAKHVHLLMSCLYDSLSPATQRLVQLNHLEPYLMQPNDISQIREHSTNINTNLQLLGLYTEQKEIREVIALRYSSNNEDQFRAFLTLLDHYSPTLGYRYNLLIRSIPVYSVDLIQDAIDYENIMNIYDYPFYSSSSEEEKEPEQIKLEIIRKLTS